MIFPHVAELRIGRRLGSVTLPCPRDTAGDQVADWSQAGIGYTWLAGLALPACVADWSQAGIGYTWLPPARRGQELRIGRRLGSVTLLLSIWFRKLELRIGRRLGSVTLAPA